MSTKRLARTVLERGRPNSDKNQRRYQHRQNRRAMRDYLHEVKKDAEVYEAKIEPKSISALSDYGPILTDKLTPVNNWINSRVGKPWSITRRLIKETFDTRSLAGYHVVKAHILGEIANCGEQESPLYYRNYDDDVYYVNISERFFVDENDILRETPEISYKRRIFSYEQQQEEVIKWLNQRYISQVDGILCWNVHKTGYTELKSYINTWRNIYDVSHVTHLYFKSNKLSSDEVRYFFSLPKWVQDYLIITPYNEIR